MHFFFKNWINFQSGWATQGLGVLPAQSYDGHCGKWFIQGSVSSVVELEEVIFMMYINVDLYTWFDVTLFWWFEITLISQFEFWHQNFSLLPPYSLWKSKYHYNIFHLFNFQKTLAYKYCPFSKILTYRFCWR